MVGGVIHVYVEVAGDEEFMRCGCCSGEKRCEFIQKGRQWLDSVSQDFVVSVEDTQGQTNG